MRMPPESAPAPPGFDRWWRAWCSPEAVRDGLLLLMAFTSGYIDAVSFFGLGRVFTSVMTGNMVVLGYSLSQGQWSEVTRTLVALASYLSGVAAGTLALERGARRGVWPRSVTRACAVEGSALLAFAVIGVLTGRFEPGAATYALIALAAVAMGIQSTAARALNVSGVSTTYFTGTWTAFMEGVTRRLGARLRRRRGVAPRGELPPWRTLARQAATLGIYALGAVAGSEINVRWRLRAAAVPVAPIA
ncbi:MAG: DUF1275 domain-containing protein, partial [Ktedonobacterales bacterium]|nr:DUF1275 domain-containing protein [Ktedonobacterales bacterium]